MAVSLSAAYLAELKKGESSTNIILEAAIDFTQFLADGTFIADGSITAQGSESAGIRKWGMATGTGFSDVAPIIKSISSSQNKIDAKNGFADRGQITVVISGRDNFIPIIQDEFLKNRRVTRMEGFNTPGFLYSDYAATFSGTILDWKRKGDELTLVIADDAIKTDKKIPVEKTDKTQFINYQNTNPVDIIQDILKAQLGVEADRVDDTQFDIEQETWLPGWIFDRVLTRPEQAKDLLNELQEETYSFIVHDGEKITFKHFAPPVPGQTVPEWTDDNNIVLDSLSQNSGYSGLFFNKIVVYYDYDESGSKNEENFESAFIALDTASQSGGEWDEVRTKTIKSKWIRSHTYDQTTLVTGVTIYHVSTANGIGSGTLAYNFINNALTWTAPGGSTGEAVNLDKDGKYQIFDSSTAKWIRVIVDVSELPGLDRSDDIVITSLNGDSHAAYIANKQLIRYRDPVSTVSFSIDINDAVNDTFFLKPTDTINLTTDEAVVKGKDSFDSEGMMITGVQPNYRNSSVKIDAIQTKIFLKTGFIAPAGFPDFDTATEAQRQYAFIGRASDNKVFDGTDFVDGFYIW